MVEAKRKIRKRRRRSEELEPLEYVADVFGKEIGERQVSMPPKCAWYAWRGPATEAVLFLDTRKFEGYPFVSELDRTMWPKDATYAVVFWG